MVRAGTALALLGYLVAGCGAGSTSGSAPTTTSAPATTTTAAVPTTTVPTTAPTTTPPVTSPVPTTTSLRVYFMRTDKLAVVSRTVTATPAVAAAAVSALLAGPTPAERNEGLSSTVPTGTVLRGVTIADKVATVDLSGTFASGGGSLSMTARLAQVTYTLTQFPTVSGVLFRLDGKPVTVFGGEGIMLDGPATRASFESVTPAILVESPAPGSRVTSPLRVWGTSNVFEAVFQVEIADASGRVLAAQTVHATSGTGTRGTFDVSVRFAAPAGALTLRAFDLSAKDGSRQDMVSVPLTAG